jgi:hypothetical protein
MTANDWNEQNENPGKKNSKLARFRGCAEWVLQWLTDALAYHCRDCPLTLQPIAATASRSPAAARSVPETLQRQGNVETVFVHGFEKNVGPSSSHSGYLLRLHMDSCAHLGFLPVLFVTMGVQFGGLQNAMLLHRELWLHILFEGVPSLTKSLQVQGGA